MKLYDNSVDVDKYTGVIIYKGLEFVREDIEQIFLVLSKNASLNVMRLQQSKWDWWYDSERNVITLQDISFHVDYDDCVFEMEKIEMCYDDMLNIMNFLDNHPDILIASYKDFL
jgi:hypothetical protein